VFFFKLIFDQGLERFNWVGLADEMSNHAKF
jgi:hypothetical protein